MIVRRANGNRRTKPGRTVGVKRIIASSIVAVLLGGTCPAVSLPMEKIQWMADQLVTEGGLTRPFDMAKMIDPSIREAALARLAPGARSQ